MAIDLGKLVPVAAAPLLVPRDIFDALPDKPWSRLRLEQGEVLQKWYDNRNRRDNVIKQNTGGGKTVIGLLIAQSSLNEHVGPAVYLVPDTYLVDQVVKEADALGIVVTKEVNDVQFRAQRAILVTTFHKVLNGRSVFGVRGSNRDPLVLGTVIVDDAHASLNAAKGIFTATIMRGQPAFDKLLTLFQDDLKHQSPRIWADITAGDYSSPLRVPFWCWKERQDEVMAILRAEGEDDNWKDLYFAWPLIREHLHLAGATVTSRAIEIRTPCPAIELIPSFEQAQRRVYLTATLADDGVLVTELGADAANVMIPLTPGRASDLGDRVIIAPQGINPHIGDDSVRRLARQFADGIRDGSSNPSSNPINVVVIVPSHQTAQKWTGFADHTCDVHTLAPIVARLKAGEHLGLIVLVNKYDGVDLPGDACRLLILDGVPTPLDATESRESSALAGSDTFLARKVQRIEQGMGRAIRDAEDHCAVLLVGHELAVAIVDPAARKFFSPATRAQIQLSQQIADQIQNEGLVPIREMLDIFLRRDRSWTSPSSMARAGILYDADGHVSALAIARREAFNLATAGDFASAGNRLVEALRAMPAKERGWYGEEAAAYTNGVDPAAAQAGLGQARKDNSSALLPLVATPVRPMKPAGVQAKACSTFLNDHYANGTLLVLGVSAILERLHWDENGADAAEGAMEDIGAHLGFASDRPDKLYKVGPDNLWAVNDDVHVAFELKTEVIRNDERIWKKELDQLAGHLNWHAANYKGVSRLIPVMVHPKGKADEKGTPPQGCRYMGPDELVAFKASLNGFAQAVSLNFGWKSPEVVGKRLQEFGLTLDQAVLKHTSILR
ncbi:DEAD/DEAH box helicase family protein [Paeniglutamicibacter antarcticus]|uniref:DEAD/DEAH box helicase family protein n=1 Tax=Arthrobacter terrae TaxID=2935737 RepID=A0A931CVR7_9MICC|nr:helicase C-terminal domain-containing protein [Arthrobacter terrae]MBG0741834.1 DEAD/DEAH box helicase family protein [Arthrobacter terrae]